MPLNQLQDPVGFTHFMSRFLQDVADYSVSCSVS
jgi:hypothetical protein